MCAGRGMRETSSEFLRAGRSAENFRGSRPRKFSRILRKALRTPFFTKENGGLRTPLFIEDPRWGAHFPRAGTHETHFFNRKSHFTSFFYQFYNKNCVADILNMRNDLDVPLWVHYNLFRGRRIHFRGQNRRQLHLYQSFCCFIPKKCMKNSD